MAKTPPNSKGVKGTRSSNNANKASYEMAFESYWRAISRCEEFIRENGHYPDPHWKSRSNTQLDLAYKNVKRPLRPISKPRLIRGLPGGLNPFMADNFHQALIHFLSPPHRWFGHMSVLDSKSYVRLKQRACGEENDLARKVSLKNSVATAVNELMESERSVYEAVTKTPALGKTIGNKVDVHPDNVRKYLAKLKQLGLIRHIRGKGYVRI